MSYNEPYVPPSIRCLNEKPATCNGFEQQSDPFAAILDAPETAPSILLQAHGCISDRAQSRDQADGERSMGRCVASFNAMFGHNLTETQGWQFMLLLKMARGVGGKFHLDDYIDAAAYAALAGECAAGEAQ